jgi:hypothetical protein
MSLKSKVVGEINLNLKNIIGWKTNRKFIVFSIDDYGNVRNNSKESRDTLFKNGLTPKSAFDLYDSLETESDLLALYETLSSVKDSNGNPAVFTAFSTCANIDFEKMIATNFEKFYYEDLDATFAKLPGYENVKKLWNEGIQNKLLIPQFHGREHLNVNVLMNLLREKNKQVLLNFQNKSYSSIDDVGLNPIPYSAAFDFNKPEELEQLKEIINDGLRVFEKVFGYKATHFNACGSHKYHHSLEDTLHENGIKFIDAQRIQHEHHGYQKYSKSFNYTGKKNSNNQTYLVRNCVFEPTDASVDDWVNFTLKQIEASFRWQKPANISSHRVNFCGHIEESNRKIGLSQLNELLKRIVKRWPDVEFVSANELGEAIIKNKP